MTLSAGTRLGAYEVLSHLGSGGMGEVYRSRDTRLMRDVAIKVLPESLTFDHERLARFKREAHVLASLNHPKIASIFGLEEFEGTPFLVLELVPGEDLSAHLSRGALPVDEALDLARQMAEGLEAAHEAGVVHRDLKPANVKVTPDGSVKILDFGLAKALAADAGESANDLSRSPTLTSPSTALGVILGTASYMAPEQARGRKVDRRADIWAFGVVLWEMLTGERLFAGDTVPDVLAAVLTKEIDFKRLSGGPRIVQLVRRCLTRDPKQRLHDAGDARIELEEVIQERRSGLSAPLVPAAGISPRRVWPLVAAAGVAAAVVGALAGRLSVPAAAPRQPAVHAVVQLPEGLSLAGWSSPTIALSRDGRTLAYVAEKAGQNRELYICDLSRGETRRVPSSETAEGPFFTPDGAAVAFATGVSMTRLVEGPLMKRYSLRTGLTESVAPIADFFGGSFASDGSIVFVNDQAGGLERLRPGTRVPDPLVAKFRSRGVDERLHALWPQLQPGDGAALVIRSAGWTTNGRVCSVDLATREITDLGVGAGYARATAKHLLFVTTGGTLMAAPFDPKARRLTGPAFAVLKDVATTCNDASALAISENGTLAYATGIIRGSGSELLRFMKVDAGGKSAPLAFDPQELYRRFVLSPSGELAAAPGWDGAVWIYDLARGTKRKLAGAQNVESLAFSRDGKSLAVVGPRADGAQYDLYIAPLDGSAPPRKVLDHPQEIRLGAFASDGRLLVVELGFGLLAVSLERGTSERIRLESKEPYDPSVSPDGTLLAYCAGDTGRSEIYVSAVSGGAAFPISTGGGALPRWSRDGREVAYLAGDTLMSVPISVVKGVPAGGRPQRVAELPALFAFDTLPGRGEFVALQRAPGSGIQTQIHVIVNFLDELARLGSPAN
ncbi:MAG: protein kinase [Thermoanaerobaculia bacterium]